MRTARGAILLLILLLPIASAQVPALPVPAPQAITIELGEFSGPVVPRGASQQAEGVLTISCALAATSPQTGLVVIVEATTLPDWASVVVSPPAVLVDPKTCTGPTVIVPLLVSARAGSGGIADDAGEVSITATAQTPAGAQTGSDASPLTLGYYGGFDLKANSTRATLTSLSASAATISVTHTGNARSILTFTVKGAEGVAVDAIAPLTLDPGATADVTVAFRSTKDVGLQGRTDPVSVEATSAREGSAQTGITRKVEISVATLANTPTESDDNDAPGPAGALIALAVAAVALSSRRR